MNIPRRISILRMAATMLAFLATATLAETGAAGQASIGIPSARAQTATTGQLKLHVPSPDWRDQIIYFLMTDRFNDGDPANNDLAAGEFDPASNAKYNGGDLRGVEQKLDYIRGLGATAVWISPPVANQWWDPLVNYGGYHGYWAENFMAVDRHLGTLDDYRGLSHALHAAGMYLVQDIVVNHTGNFFAYEGGWSAADPARHFTLNGGSKPAGAPSQWPFSMNDARNPEHRRAAIYHWTPNVVDFTDPRQESDWQMGGLDDLNTENPQVRQSLRESYGYWIREVGVDAFRVDTAFYVPATYFADFMYSRDARHPGMASVARQTGRRHFHVFGEGFGIDKPYADKQARKIERYMTAADGRPLLPGMLNFPLYATLGDVFARGRPPAELAYRIEAMMKLHRRPHLMATFVDNHDVDRFLAGGSIAALKQSLLTIMTLPGIPTIYYGTEQAFTEPRAAMFKAGFQSGGRDRFDTTAPLYRYLAAVSSLRRSHRVFSRGTPTILKSNAATPGALAYRMSAGADSMLVMFNTSPAATLLDNLDTRLPAGTVLQGLFGIDGMPADVTVGAAGRITLTLAPHSGQVWRVARHLPKLAAAAITMRALPRAAMRGDFPVSGTARGTNAFRLVIDGDLAGAQMITPAPDRTWAASVDTGRMLDASVHHSVVAWAESSAGMPAAVSATRAFRVERNWTLLAEAMDPAGDDRGPRGTYIYPTDATWGVNRQMDIRHLKVSGAGGAMKIDVTMNKITTFWNPQNGFDHVAFTLFIEVPGRDGGATLMPLQNGVLPAGMRWHYRLRAHGWSNALFAADGASATQEGTLVTPAADIRADAALNTVTFILPASALGQLKTLSGVKLYVTTWDYDGGYRALSPDAQHGSIGGGHPQTDPRVMDDTPVIILP
ncbi:MAG: alpha-amylase family glycosyl hydrolase [Betaproteobacteria bacterium]